jgi:hypothetical protein
MDHAGSDAPVVLLAVSMARYSFIREEEKGAKWRPHERLSLDTLSWQIQAPQSEEAGVLAAGPVSI